MCHPHHSGTRDAGRGRRAAEVTTTGGPRTTAGGTTVDGTTAGDSRTTAG
jgi:hypothetical protein